jgi:hypothetical protein
VDKWTNTEVQEQKSFYRKRNTAGSGCEEGCVTRTPPAGPWTIARTAGPLRAKNTNYEFDDSQIDAHGFSSFRSHDFASLPSLSTNFPQNELILIHGFGRNGRVEQERPVFDLERYWKV